MAAEKTSLYTPHCLPDEFLIGTNPNSVPRLTLLFRTFNTHSDCCISHQYFARPTAF